MRIIQQCCFLQLILTWSEEIKEDFEIKVDQIDTMINSVDFFNTLFYLALIIYLNHKILNSSFKYNNSPYLTKWGINI